MSGNRVAAIGVVGLGLALEAGGAQAAVTINPTGGTTAGNGLCLVVEPDTTFQVQVKVKSQRSAQGQAEILGTKLVSVKTTAAKASFAWKRTKSS